MSDDLEEDNAILRRQLNNLAHDQERNESLLHDAVTEITLVQNNKSYRVVLLLTRFWLQMFKYHQGRDFFIWLFQTMMHKQIGQTQLLKNYDSLEKAKVLLNNYHSLCIMSSTEGNGSMVIKRNRTVVIFASVPFYDVGGGQRSAKLAKAFNSYGYYVVYLYIYPCNEKNIPFMRIPASIHKQLNRSFTTDQFKSMIDTDSIVLFEIPHKEFMPYLAAAHETGCHIVYEHIDNWETSLGTDFYSEEIMKCFIDKAEIVTATAKKLADMLGRYTDKDIVYLPNAVDTDVFSLNKKYYRPAELFIGKTTLVYWGSLWGSWFDWDIVKYLSENIDCEINLIGDASGVSNETRRGLRRNIHFLGLKKQEYLPEYLMFCDAAILPFKNDHIGQYVSPLKIFEYLALNKPVLATRLPDIIGYPDVYCSDRKEDWAEYLRNGLKCSDHALFTDHNSWFARCDNLVSMVDHSRYNDKKISVIILNYNNENVIMRCVESLIDHNRRYDYEIIVVDNGSTDDSEKRLKTRFGDKVSIYKNDVNGCASGRNLGVEKAVGSVIVFLDSDQWVISDYWLDNALKLLDKGSRIGAVGWTGGWLNPGNKVGPTVDDLPDKGICSESIWYRTDIAYLGTGGMVLKKSVFEAVGGFDTAYDPTCFEDTDLSLLIRDNGYELAYCPSLLIRHMAHQTTEADGKDWHFDLLEKNGKYFFKKWNVRNKKLLEYYY